MQRCRGNASSSGDSPREQGSRARAPGAGCGGCGPAAPRARPGQWHRGALARRAPQIVECLACRHCCCLGLRNRRCAPHEHPPVSTHTLPRNPHLLATHTPARTQRSPPPPRVLAMHTALCRGPLKEHTPCTHTLCVPSSILGQGAICLALCRYEGQSGEGGAGAGQGRGCGERERVRLPAWERGERREESGRLLGEMGKGGGERARGERAGAGRKGQRVVGRERERGREGIRVVRRCCVDRLLATRCAPARAARRER